MLKRQNQANERAAWLAALPLFWLSSPPPHRGLCLHSCLADRHHSHKAIQLLGQSCGQDVGVKPGWTVAMYSLYIVALTLEPQGLCQPHSHCSGPPAAAAAAPGRWGRGLRLPSGFSVEGFLPGLTFLPKPGSPCYTSNSPSKLGSTGA